MILDSVNGTDLTPVQKARIELVNDHIKQLSSNIQKLDKLINLMIEPYEDYISFCVKYLVFLETLPSLFFLKSV